MIGRHEGNATIATPIPTETRDAGGFSQQPFNGSSAEGHEDLRLNQINLLLQIPDAGSHFVRSGLAITRHLPRSVRPALQNIGDIDRVTTEAHSLDNFGEKLAGFPNERFPLLVFVCSRGLTDEHQPGFGAANAEDDVLARGDQMRALNASHRPLPQLRKSRCFSLWAKSRKGVDHGV